MFPEFVTRYDVFTTADAYWFYLFVILFYFPVLVLVFLHHLGSGIAILSLFVLLNLFSTLFNVLAKYNLIIIIII